MHFHSNAFPNNQKPKSLIQGAGESSNNNQLPHSTEHFLMFPTIDDSFLHSREQFRDYLQTIDDSPEPIIHFQTFSNEQNISLAPNNNNNNTIAAPQTVNITATGETAVTAVPTFESTSTVLDPKKVFKQNPRIANFWFKYCCSLKNFLLGL